MSSALSGLKRGHNKFLAISKNVAVVISEQEIAGRQPLLLPQKKSGRR
jgi:hypothetical protein